MSTGPAAPAARDLRRGLRDLGQALQFLSPLPARRVGLQDQARSIGS